MLIRKHADMGHHKEAVVRCTLPVTTCSAERSFSGANADKDDVTMATAVCMSNTTSDSLTTELSRTVVPCALKNNRWLVYN